MRKAAKNKVRSGLIAALDVGSTKIACFIGRCRDDGTPDVIGIGHQISRGIKNGVVVDMDEAEASIRACVEAAEQMAGENVHEVVVNLSGGQMTSRLIAFDVLVSGHEIGAADLRRVMDPHRLQEAKPHDHEILHTIPVSYSIDGTRGVRDPRGMFGERLGVNLHIVSAPTNTLRNLATCVARCHLNVGAIVAAPYAAGLACLVEDEKELGVTVIDLGGGTTSIGVFFDGELVHVDSVAVGGMHVTSDLARGLSTPLIEAERLKTLHGNAIPSASDDRSLVTVPAIGEEDDEANHLPRSMLVGIIRPRLEETFEIVRSRLEAAGIDRSTGRRVVLTGGASLLPGVRDLASAILEKQVRLGRPNGVHGLAEAVSGPAFATTAGLLAYALDRMDDAEMTGPPHLDQPSSTLGRFGMWLRTHFWDFDSEKRQP